MTMTIKPAPGRRVRVPELGYTELPAEGLPVTWSPYWERAIQDGDVVAIKAKRANAKDEDAV
jgi:hypothetical protein